MITVPKGTKDVLPDSSYKWQYLENIIRETCALYGAREIRTPVFEHTELFLRSIGDDTDVVNKEMYTFEDKGGRSITLKPEGTAPVARSYIENSLEALSLPLKMYYITPVFRYERPQAGRLREHHQFGVEFYGSSSPAMDYEVLNLAYRMLTKAGVNVTLKINSIGCENCRKGYRGRIAIQEVLELDDALRSAINNEKLTKEELTKMVYTDKTITMLQDALGKALEGITSFEEVYRVIEIESEDAGHYDDEEAESETEQGNTLADIPTTVIKQEDPTPQQEQPTTFEEQKPVQTQQPQEPVTETETLEQVTLEVPNFLSQTPSTEPPTEAKTEPPHASVDNLLSGLIPVIDETPVSHPVEVEEENEQEELFIPQQANTTEQIVLPNISQEQPTEAETEPTPVETNTNDTFIQLNTGEPETESVTEPETEVTTEQTEVLTLEKLDTTVEEINEDDTKSVLSTDIEIKGMAGINAEPLLPQF